MDLFCFHTASNAHAMMIQTDIRHHKMNMKTTKEHNFISNKSVSFSLTCLEANDVAMIKFNSEMIDEISSRRRNVQHTQMKKSNWIKKKNKKTREKKKKRFWFDAENSWKEVSRRRMHFNKEYLFVKIHQKENEEEFV